MTVIECEPTLDLEQLAQEDYGVSHDEKGLLHLLLIIEEDKSFEERSE